MGPKVIFILHAFYLIRREIFDMSSEGECCELLFTIVLLCAIFVTVPLVPYVLFLFIFGGDECEFCVGYIVLVSYLLISYGGSCVYVFSVVAMSTISVPVLMSIIVLIALIVVISVTFRCSVVWMKNTN